MRTPTVAICLALAVLSRPVLADVTIEATYDVEAAGALNMFASRGSTATMVSGDKSRGDSSFESKSKLVKTFSGGSNRTSTITRLDKGVIWNLEPEKSRYTELSFDQVRAQMNQAMEQMKSAREAQNQQGQDLPVSEQSCQMEPGGPELRQTGSKATIAGLDAEQWIRKLPRPGHS
jgi:hypothetical protein